MIFLDIKQSPFCGFYQRKAPSFVRWNNTIFRINLTILYIKKTAVLYKKNNEIT